MILLGKKVTRPSHFKQGQLDIVRCVLWRTYSITNNSCGAWWTRLTDVTRLCQWWTIACLTTATAWVRPTGIADTLDVKNMPLYGNSWQNNMSMWFQASVSCL